MTASSLITVSVSLTMTRIATLRDEFSRATRMSCDFSLDLHQPEPGYPDRLLGICAGSGIGTSSTWYPTETRRRWCSYPRRASS